MASNQVLFISFWNPTKQQPQSGTFIHEQAAAICKVHDNVIFMQVNVLPARNIFLETTIFESDYYNNTQITINLYSRLWKFYYVNPWLLAFILGKIIKKRKSSINPSIIHSNVIHPCGIVGYLLSRNLGSELIISEHWSRSGKFLNHPLYRFIAVKAYNKSHAIICVSQFLSGMIAGHINNKNIIIIPNIVNNKIFNYQPKQLSGDGGLTFLCVASWKLPKRLDLIIDALCSFSLETDKIINLKVVGEGPQAELLKKKKMPENLHIEWLGFLKKDEIAGLYKFVNVFLHASDIETFSIVTAEALSTGTPVIVSNTGALPELVSEISGITVENSIDAWLKGIKVMVTRSFDYYAISAQYKDKFSPSSIAGSIISVYHKTQEQKSGFTNRIT